MGTFIVKRLLGLIPIMIGISIIIFLIMRMLPGDVASMILMGGSTEPTTGVSEQAVAQLREQLGLNAPLYQQYFDWAGGLLRLDAGISLWTKKPVLDEIMSRLPLTAELALMGLCISLVIAVPIGVISALKQNSLLDYFFRSVTIAGLAVPGFFLATLLILALTIWFNWIPPLGYVSFNQDPWANLQQLFLPAAVIGFSNAAILARMTRSAMLEVLREDYVRTAWAKGLGFRAVLSGHALRNAMLPILTLAAIELGQLLSGAVVMETIFSLPGIGRYLIDAIFHRDYPVVQAIILLIGLMYVLLNLAVDIAYGLFDPRIRYS